MVYLGTNLSHFILISIYIAKNLWRNHQRFLIVIILFHLHPAKTVSHTTGVNAILNSRKSHEISAFSPTVKYCPSKRTKLLSLHFLRFRCRKMPCFRAFCNFHIFTFSLQKILHFFQNYANHGTTLPCNVVKS